VKLSLESLEREVRNLKRDIDRVSGGGLLVRQNLDMRNFRIVNLGNPETTSDAGTTATSTGTTTSTVTVTGGVAGPASSTVNAITTWGDSSGTTLLSGAAALTSAGALSGLTTVSLSGQLTSTLATGTAPLVVASATQVANLYAARAALADTVTTNANLTGPITSVGNATAVAAQTGTGSTFVMSAGPTLTGTIAGASLSLSSLTSGRVPYATTAGLLTDSASFTYNGTDLGMTSGNMFIAALTRFGYGGSATGGWSTRQNLSGNLVTGSGVTDELTLSTAALFPSTTGGLDLGLTGTRWGAGYFSGQVNAATLSLTGNIAFGTSGARIEQPASGLELYGASGTSVKVALNDSSDAIEFYDTAGSTLMLMDGATQGIGIYGALSAFEVAAHPSAPSANDQMRVYLKADNLVFQFNQAGTTRYLYIPLTGTGTTWTHDTTGP
jgi:hypothetical protein